MKSSPWPPRWLRPLFISLFLCLGIAVLAMIPEHNRRAESCRAQGGVVFAGRDGNICIREDAIIRREKL